MRHASEIDGEPAPRMNLQRLGDRLVAFIASRKPDHWVMFAAGLMLGLLLG